MDEGTRVWQFEQLSVVCDTAEGHASRSVDPGIFRQVPAEDRPVAALGVRKLPGDGDVRQRQATYGLVADREQLLPGLEFQGRREVLEAFEALAAPAGEAAALGRLNVGPPGLVLGLLPSNACSPNAFERAFSFASRSLRVLDRSALVLPRRALLASEITVTATSKAATIAASPATTGFRLAHRRRCSHADARRLLMGRLARNSSRSSARSRAEVYRFFGSRAAALSTIVSRSRGMSGSTSRGRRKSPSPTR